MVCARATSLAVSPRQVDASSSSARHQQAVSPDPAWLCLLLVLSCSVCLQGNRSQQISSLWRGVGASLSKDVPFAGLYWTLLEPSRTWLDSHAHISHSSSGINMHTLAINALAGSVAGAAAAAVTTPFDVVKTRLQTRDAQLERKGTLECLVSVAKTGGVRGLFSGWGPRTLRTAAAYGILMSSYEICKGIYSTRPSE